MGNMIAVSEDLLDRLWPHGDAKIAGLRKAVAASSARVFVRYGIATALDVAHFMAQLSHECGAGLEVEENLSYSASRIPQVWPSRFKSVAAALPYAKNPRKLANNVYGSRMGNHPGTDDGYNYRGRGGSQTTGLDAYRRLGAITGLDLVNHPELVNDPSWFLECAAADYVRICGCLPFGRPRPGLPQGDIRAVTHHLNGGYIGLAERQAWFAKWWQALRQAAPAALPAASLALLADASSDPVAGEGGADASAEVAELDDGVLRYGAAGFEVKALQDQLVSLGYMVGAREGDFGGGTRAAVLAFQADNGLPTSGEVDAATRAALKTAPPKPVSEARANATAQDLRAGGSVTIAKADQLSWWGRLTAFVGIGGGTAQKTGLLDTVKDSADQVSSLRSVVETVQDVGQWALSCWWVFGIIGGFFAAKFGADIIRRRLEDHRSAVNMKQ